MLTKEQRSNCMSRIRGKDTKPEFLLRKALWRAGYRYRLKSRLTGRPDIVFPGKKVAIFVDGCFWHGCPEHRTQPKTNSEFWRKKLSRNIMRDKEVTAQLESDGWCVLRFWEHMIKGDVGLVVVKIQKALRGGKN